MQGIEKEIYTYMESHKGDIISDIIELVEAESPSNDKAAADACGHVLENLYKRRLDVSPEIFPQNEVGDNLCTTFGSGERKILVLGHFDTVHPLKSVPIRQENDLLYGPGVSDMKGGDVIVIWALKALKDLGAPLDKQFVIVNNSDEEIGSFHSKDLILEKAAGCDACIVAEPADAKTGGVKLGRKGLGLVDIRCYGVAAHARNNLQDGVNANKELAHQLLFLEGLTDFERGTTFSVNRISGGKALNVVCDYAEATADWRITVPEEAQRIESILKERKPFLKGSRVEYESMIGRPPFPETPQNLALFDLLCRTAKAMDMNAVKVPMVGGGSDGNFVADAGIPTIDGMGVWGDLMHNPGEFLRLNELVPRAALLSAFFLRV